MWDMISTATWVLMRKRIGSKIMFEFYIAVHFGQVYIMVQSQHELLLLYNTLINGQQKAYQLGKKEILKTHSLKSQQTYFATKYRPD